MRDDLQLDVVLLHHEQNKNIFCCQKSRLLIDRHLQNSLDQPSLVCLVGLEIPIRGRLLEHLVERNI